MLMVRARAFDLLTSDMRSDWIAVEPMAPPDSPSAPTTNGNLR